MVRLLRRSAPPARSWAPLPRRWGPLVLALASACHRDGPRPSGGAAPAPGASESAPRASAGADAASAAPGAATPSPIGHGQGRVGATPSVFSAPIAAARVGGATVVAGLVQPDAVVRVLALRGDRVDWSADVVHGARWTADAALLVVPAGDGVAVAWISGRTDARTGSLAILGPHGEVRGTQDGVGASVCATTGGVAWIGAEAHGPAWVRGRAWDDPAPHDAASIPADRTPWLYCGAHAAFVLGDGDDDKTLVSFVPGQGRAAPPIVAMRDGEFADEERDHYAFTAGDDLVFVRVSDAGDVALRRIAREGAPSPWRRWRKAIGEDDDVVVVDGDAEQTVLVVTGQAGAPCATTGTPADRLRAIRFDRGDTPASAELAPPNCDRAPGPEWVGTAPGAGPVVAWADGLARPQANRAPIVALGFRGIGAAGGAAGEIPIEAAVLVDAGCDDTGCFAAALEQGPDADAMHPMPIVVLGYR